MKIHKEVKTVSVIGYMGKEEQREVRTIEYDELTFYLCKSGTKWGIWEATTRKMFVAWKDTRKEALNKLQESMEQHGDKVRHYVKYGA